MLLISIVSSVLAQAAIFGVDDRLAVTPSSPENSLGRSTAVAVLSSIIEPSQTVMGTYRILPDSLSKFFCPDERFANDPSLSYACSGFLVAPDLLVTAGHCMVNTGETKDEKEMYCSVYGWLFDYQRDDSGFVKQDGITPDNYYRCKRIVYAIKEEQFPFRDYALVQLERPVLGRTPFPLSTALVKEGDVVSMFGYPLGTPLKLSRNARVTLPLPERQSFLTTLDAFEGNSGSVVLNGRGEAVGILVGGMPSANLVTDLGRSCERYNRCDDFGGSCLEPDKDLGVFPNYLGVGSEVQRIAPIVELLKGLE